jgi:hypothetical protein
VGGDYRQQLGWITPERRWVKVETGAVDKLVLSPDGSEYAYTIQPDAGRPTVLVVRGVRTDAARRRYPLPETWRLVGWNRTGLVLGVHDPQQGTSTYVWPPGAPAPTLIGKGLAPEVVSRGTRILGVAEGEDCRITVLDSTGAAPMSVKGCGPAKLSPDGRYLVRGLVVTDLDTGGSTDLVPRDAAGGGAPRTVAMHELVGPTSPFDWIDDRTVHLDVEVEEATYISLRCTVPTGPCVRVEE